MSEIKHVVGVYKIENGEPNLLKRKYKHEFVFEVSARKWANAMNDTESKDGDPEYIAIYEIEIE